MTNFMTNFKNSVKGLVLAVMVFGAVAPAMATLVSVTTTVDVADIVPPGNGFTGGVQGSPPFSPPFSVQMSAGDTFNYTINFLPGQQLTIVNPTLLWAFSYADLSTDVTGTGSLSLLDSTGAAIYTSNVKTDTEGSVHFGQQFANTDFTGLPASVTFSGLHYVGTVNYYVDPTITVRTYYIPAFYFSAGSYTTTPVPEPTTMVAGALLLLPFGLSAVRHLRNRKQAA
jgi:hypothetical protein